MTLSGEREIRRWGPIGSTPSRQNAAFLTYEIFEIIKVNAGTIWIFGKSRIDTPHSCIYLC